MNIIPTFVSIIVNSFNIVNGELVLDNIDILFIHKNRPKLEKEAVLINVTKVELCQDYFVDIETWEVWRVEGGQKILNPIQTLNRQNTRDVHAVTSKEVGGSGGLEILALIR